MKIQYALMVLMGGIASCTIAQSDNFVIAASDMLNVEVPKMEAAVRAGDRAYFGPATERVQKFITAQGGKLESSPECASASIDFLIAGLCRIPSANPICEPESFIPRFEANLASCHAAAKSLRASSF
jgi:hypothetical protein